MAINYTSKSSNPLGIPSVFATRSGIIINDGTLLNGGYFLEEGRDAKEREPCVHILYFQVAGEVVFKKIDGTFVTTGLQPAGEWYFLHGIEQVVPSHTFTAPVGLRTTTTTAGFYVYWSGGADDFRKE